jgi:hypothetical protein
MDHLRAIPEAENQQIALRALARRSTPHPELEALRTLLNQPAL